MIAVFCSILIETLNLIFVGHMGNNSMIAGVGLGNLFINMLCQAAIIGTNHAVATFVSQAYGARNMKK